ncbi:hypothetical protein AGIG_G9520 [Arapaima gigas]
MVRNWLEKEELCGSGGLRLSTALRGRFSCIPAQRCRRFGSSRVTGDSDVPAAELHVDRAARLSSPTQTMRRPGLISQVPDLLQNVQTQLLSRSHTVKRCLRDQRSSGRHGQGVPLFTSVASSQLHDTLRGFFSHSRSILCVQLRRIPSHSSCRVCEGELPPPCPPQSADIRNPA